jgi:hypothetical protein
MSIKTRFLGVAAAAVAVVAGQALPASAATAGTVVFDGHTSSVTCAPSGTTIGCPGVGIPYVGGVGTYSFATGSGVGGIPPFCLEAGFNSGPSVFVTDECSISSSGSFSNIVCGTGTAGGTATIAAGTPAVNVGGNPATGASYAIVFVAGVGVLEGTAGFANGGSGPMAGVILLQAADTGGAPGTSGPCVFNFDVLGAVVAATTS